MYSNNKMNMYKILIALILVTGVIAACAQTQKPKNESGMKYNVTKTDAEWKKILTPEQFDVARKAGTEPAYSGKYWNNHEHGMYYCVCCHQSLFSSDTKFESGTGWPSFFQAIDKTHVQEITDNTYGMSRTEVRCSNCGAHLGHVFDDGPAPTHLRYCMNSASLSFEKN